MIIIQNRSIGSGWSLSLSLFLQFKILKVIRNHPCQISARTASHPSHILPSKISTPINLNTASKLHARLNHIEWFKAPQLSKNQAGVEIQSLPRCCAADADTQYVSVASCVIRADFNLVIAFFAYFIKQQKLNSLVVKLEIALFLASLVLDLAYGILDVRVWYQIDQYQPVWQTVFPIHVFVSGIWAIEFLLKIGVLVLLFLLKKNLNN